MSKFLYVMINLILIFGIGSLIFWGLGNLIIWAFHIDYNWTFLHGFVVDLIYMIIDGMFRHGKEKI